MQNVLITGSGGFLGKYLVNHLSAQNTLHTLSRSNSNFYSIDLATQIPVITTKYNLVVHAAGKAHSIPKSKEEAEDFYTVNELGTRHLCQGFENAGLYPDHFVFISSVAVYGLETGNMINEESPLLGKSPYAKSKINTELFLESWCNNKPVKLTILRLPLIAGINPPGNLGSMIRAINKNRYFNIGRGDARKSMVLAEDVAKAIPFAAAAGGTYNLTDGSNCTMATLSKLIAKQLGKPDPKSIPVWLAKLIAFVGNIYGQSAPLNTSKLTKLMCTLTFDDTKARKAFGWNSRPVYDHLTIN
ncbi:MAG: NAD-dependent epimerase/dehydratase family protein [Bacteroidota bacterium]